MLFFNQLLSSLEIVSTNTGVAINKKNKFQTIIPISIADKSSNRLSTKINIIATPIIVNEVLIVLDIVELIDLFTISGK
jgi:transcription elongation factor